MKNAIIVNNTTQEQLTETILKEVKKEFKDLKLHYQPKEPEEFLTRTETAELLKISLVTVHQWSNQGILNPYKVGNRTYYLRKEINDQLYNSNR
jgi:hypothetical protein